MAGALSAAIFRRGGPKKELFLVSAEEQDEAELEEKLSELTELLHADKIGKDLSAAIWRPSEGAAELVLTRRNSARDIGYVKGKKTFLHIEEAVFLVDRSDMLLFVEDTRGQQRLLSLQECYDLMVTNGVSMERYIVYSTLNRSGYLVMRHPTRWILRSNETQHSVWGAHAWAGCFEKPHTPQTTHPALSSASETVNVSAQLLHSHTEGTTGGSSSSECPGASSSLEHTLNAIPGSGLKRKAQAEASEGTDPVPDIKCPEQGLEGRIPVSLAASTEAQVTEATSATEGLHRSWWPASNSSHPWLAVVSHFCEEVVRVDITQRTGEQLRELLPRLRPFAKIHRSQHLGPARHASHLVFDVYKPGTHVSRSKGIFPTPHYHLAICSESPPTLQDMRAADIQGQPGVRIKWLAVENGDISTYGMDPVDLMHLM